MDKQNVINNIISSIIGVVIGFGLDKFKTATPFQWILIFVLLVILLLVYVLTGPVKYILRSRKSFDVDGEWKSVWKYKKQNEFVVITEKILIKQLGRFIRGKATSERIDGNHPFKSLIWSFEAVILEGGVVEGKWINSEKGKNYRGLFQGHIHSSGKRVNITWLGIENNGVRNGTALWERN